MDYQSTTPMDPMVKDVIIAEFDHFGNPHSRTHSFGWYAEEQVEIARKRIADVISADAKDIIFTSGATQSNNMALQGLAYFYQEKKNHIITLVTEHKCIIETSRFLHSKGFVVTFLPVQKNGIVDLDLLKKTITDKTLVVSIMAVHNEIGVIQPLKAIGAICRDRGVFFHTDCAQAFGKIPLDVNEMNIDLMSISAHKIYGPKGVGALYVRRRPNRVRLTPIMHGGGQERGLRSGTNAMPIIAGFGKAAELAMNLMPQDNAKVTKYFNRLYDNIVLKHEETYLNGDKNFRYHGNINISFGFIEGESMIMAIKQIGVSSGSACTSASLEPSYVINALGMRDDLAHTSIRFGFGRFTTDVEIDYLVSLLDQKIHSLRELSPLWEMHKEGIDINKIEWSHH